MNRLVPLTSLFLLPFFAGCAGVSAAPTEQANAARTFETYDDKGVVYLYRPGQALGAASSTQIRVNGVVAGGTGPSTFFMWKLKPGAYTFAASTTESAATVQLNVEAGRLYFIRQTERLGLQRGGRVGMVEMDESTGKRALSGLRLLTSAYVPEQ